MNRARLFAACVWWTGCTGPSGYCEHVRDAGKECGIDFVGDIEECRTAYAGCTIEEEDALIAFFDCVLALEPCDGTRSVTDDVIAQCLGELDVVSETCVEDPSTT